MLPEGFIFGSFVFDLLSLFQTPFEAFVLKFLSNFAVI